MGILLSDISNRDMNYKMEVEQSSPLDSAVESLILAYKGMDDEYTNIIMEYLHVNLMANSSDNPLAISLENLSDTASSIKQWFIKWLAKFRKFIRDCIHKMKARYTYGEKIVSKYMKELPNFEPFEVYSYKYTIAPTELEINEIINVMSTVRSGYIRIMRCGHQELSAVTAVERSKVSGKFILDEIRGKLVHQPSMPMEEFRSSLHAMFRNNMPVKTKTNIDRSKLVAMCREFMELKRLIPAIKRNKDSIEHVTNDIIDFIGKQPNAIKEYHSQYSPNYVHYMTKNIFGQRKADYDELVTRKTTALNMYFATANTSLKQIQLLYDYFFAAKIDAINDAMNFYIKCLEKAYSIKKG